MHSPVTGRVSSEYSPSRRNPVTGRVEQHAGIDIANSTGTPIYAAFAGTVEAVGTNIVPGRTGTGILIRNPDGERQYYGHLSKALVKGGQKVAEGEQIGLVGATGNATGPHLHFETWNKSRKALNPRIYFEHHGLTPGKAGPALPAWYCVDVGRSATLLGRAGPSTRSKILQRRKRGFRIKVNKIVTGGGRKWAVSNYGTHYALEYLKRGKTL